MPRSNGVRYEFIVNVAMRQSITREAWYTFLMSGKIKGKTIKESVVEMADARGNKDTNNELAAYHPLLRTLLKNRGITTRADAEKFLNPEYERDMYDPFLILNMEKAVERILKAIQAEENIVVYGDYDCDGIPGSVILHDFFKKINCTHFKNYIPHRHTEGYGLNTGAIDGFAKDDTTVLITVDCGITDVEETAYANSFGIDVIITDHHLPQDVLPPAYVILNSKQKGDTYPDPMLCGAGVAWKLVCALLKRGKEKGMFAGIPDGWEKWLLDMTGLATIADMVPLVNENRALAHFGLKVLRKSARPGLQKLLRVAKVEQEHLTEGDVGFMIAPRINAASRMDVPMEAFRLLSAVDDADAGLLAEKLHTLNDERKWAVAVMMKEVKKTLAVREKKEVIVIGNPKWRVGVLGIAASHIVEEYDRPAFVWGREGSSVIKGSCRSDGSVNLVELMTSVSEEIFLGVGGHEFAGGFSIAHEKIHLLEDELVSAYGKVRREKEKNNAKIIDASLSLDDVNWNVYAQVERLAPFGVGNQEPTFEFKNVTIEEVKMFGKEKDHLELSFRNVYGKVVAIGFFMKADTFEARVEKGARITLIATMEKSLFRRTPELRLRIVDIIAPQHA